MTTLSSPSTTVQDELTEAATAQGRKLGFFIAALNTSDEIKQAWLDLLPNLSLPQLERLSNIMESKYLAEQTRSIDEDFKTELEKIKSDFGGQDEANDKKVLAQIEDLERQLAGNHA